jgi:transcriptional regulator with XRE-family HTH domain
MSKTNSQKNKYLLEKLRSARLKAGFTQVEAEKLLKKPQAYISKIERGECGVDAVGLAEFAKVYNKDINYFIR